jgi:hypothetical protein
LDRQLSILLPDDIGIGPSSASSQAAQVADAPSRLIAIVPTTRLPRSDQFHASRVRMSVKGTNIAVKGTDNAVKGTDNAVEGTDNAVKGTDDAVKGMDNAVKGMDNAIKGTDNAVKGTDNAVERRGTDNAVLVLI